MPWRTRLELGIGSTGSSNVLGGVSNFLALTARNSQARSTRAGERGRQSTTLNAFGLLLRLVRCLRLAPEITVMYSLSGWTESIVVVEHCSPYTLVERECASH
jgi:hypothetical protein